MAKRMILMLAVMALFIGALGFVKFRQIQTAIAQGSSFQPPPDAVTTIVAQREEWPATLAVIGTMAAVQGVTVSTDLPGTVDRIAFESGKSVRAGEVLVQLDIRQERSQLAALEAQRDLARLNIARMKDLLLVAGAGDSTLSAAEESARSEIDTAFETAKASPHPPLSRAFADVQDIGNPQRDAF